VSEEIVPSVKKGPGEKLERLFWVDLEMSGLDEFNDVILEVAVLISDLEFNVIAEYEVIVQQPQSVLDGMDDWCKEHHGKSGLTAAVPHGRPIQAVEDDLLAIIDKHFSQGERVILCGNSVGTDRRFLIKGMPRLAERLHYRVIDVTSFKEIFWSRFGLTIDKAEGHRALVDIRESMAELQHYVSFIKVD